MGFSTIILKVVGASLILAQREFLISSFYGMPNEKLATLEMKKSI